MGTRILDFRFGLVDLDGVLFNLGILYRREFGRFLQARYDISAKQALRFYQVHEALPLEDKFARLLAQHGRPGGEAAHAVTAFRTAVAASRPVVSEGARELVETLASRETQLFALSETESRVADGKLRDTELRQSFAHVIGIEKAPRGPGQLAHCATVIGLPLEGLAAQSVMLASTPEDISTAREFGFYTIGVAHVYPETTLRACGANELYRHVAHLALLVRLS